MIEFLWRTISKIASIPFIANCLIRLAQRRPYTHIPSPDGQSIYMWRWWLFNPYKIGSQGAGRQFPWSIRIHYIAHPDLDRDLHDHPWNARTIILRGGYVEVRKDGVHVRTRGSTAKLAFNEFHRIRTVADDGAWTMFITGPYRGTWGFDVDGVKVPYKQYLAERNDAGVLMPRQE